ncbi:hypothetical protein C162_26190 [Paenibacillus sp. FSL R7-269]|uniref:acyltransferase family protein n=1 Tax=Paenibacillus sp. FSL R7-269 TaxID=1226755 RepID=UPI0003E1C53B|nr:acyltransferase [Paenibacillus sp. FSL R7-269]ETT41438.1 hypothetical protein C162_26190 [Paenibacillus sp. FSL R7-269]
MNSKDNSEYHFEERNYIYILKALALVSIVSAHSVGFTSTASRFNQLSSWLLGQIGSIGVGVFFLVSGFLFYRNSRTIGNFFRKKFITIVVPWVITGTAVYLLLVIRNNEQSLSGWFNFLLGNGSYLYYLTILFVFYLIFFYTARIQVFVASTIILSCLSIVFTAAGYLEGINPYLNPLNFICYFSVGLLIAHNNLLQKMVRLCSDYRLFLFLAYLILLIIVGILNLSSGYWGTATLVSQPLSILLIMGVASMNFTDNKRIINLGRVSYSVYLLHLPVAGIITVVCNAYDSLGVFTLFRPVLAIIITVSLITIYKVVGAKLKINKHTNPLIGL